MSWREAGWLARILVVDDEPDQRFLAGRALRKAGHEVTVAEHGAMGLQAAREQVPDLVVTDVMMPVMDGAELIRRLRGDPVTAGIPILAVSGDSHLAGAADAVLAKPYKDHRLIMLVNSLLEKGRAAQ
jgi:CheY-like chemotaxis protein